MNSKNNCSCSNFSNESKIKTFWISYLPLILSSALLIFGIYLEQIKYLSFFFPLIWYLSAYLLLAPPIFKKALKEISKKNIFNEFFLMGLASLAAFFLKQYAEGVTLILFYTLGELLQDKALNKSKSHIKALLDIRPKKASVLRDGMYIEVNPDLVEKEEIIQIKPGQRAALDGILLSSEAFFDTSALSGESKPRKIKTGEKVLSGMLCLENAVEIKVSANFSDSSFSRIIDLIENFSSRKTKTENLISRIAKIYTPIVLILALLVILVPYFFDKNYSFESWLYKSLILIIISCPCALVLSIPLTYFASIGVASKKGILFKGSYYLDLLREIKTIAFDKTGTLTKGVFEVQKIFIEETLVSKKDFLSYAYALESKSTHPIALAICKYFRKNAAFYESLKAENIKEIPGHGLSGQIKDKNLLIGNKKLFEKYQVDYPKNISKIIESIALVAFNEKFVGYFLVADKLKEDTYESIDALKKLGIEDLHILSGDKISVVEQTANTLGIKNYQGELLPEEKLDYLKKIKHAKKTLAFIGDGINDAPSLVFSDIGIAMGNLGSDLAIETSDVVLQTDQLFKFIEAIKISNSTYKIIWQNIIFVFFIKFIAIFLGTLGLANLWEALLADVGACLITIINGIKIQKMKF